MFDRRKRERFTLVPPYHVWLHVLEDLAIEYMDAESIVGIVAKPAMYDERVALEINAGAGRRITVPIHVRESRPTMVNGRIRHRLIGIHGVVADAPSREEPGNPENWWLWDVVTVAVARGGHARVLDLSSAGCRLETARPLGVGTVARLTTEDVARDDADVVRVCACEARPGGVLPFQLMCELLTAHPAAPSSVRDRAVRLESAAVISRLGGAGEISAPIQTSPVGGDDDRRTAGDGVSDVW